MKENDGKAGSASLASLSEIATRIKRWRESRRRGEHIPPDIWVQALALTREHGPERVADALGLDLGRLTRRMERDGGHVASEVAVTQFVEMFVPPATPAQAAAPECVLELTNARGTKMRVQLAGNGLGALAGLCRAFVEAA